MTEEAKELIRGTLTYATRAGDAITVWHVTEPLATADTSLEMSAQFHPNEQRVNQRSNGIEANTRKQAGACEEND
ncbi:hypothetical protein R1flu_025111 [Riccia fluitans]|uniref:Uncharacterized protein n=1 Tax=Riccia fluitans TaxID=41844 RepID=A0ABD1XWV6_9MARC